MTKQTQIIISPPDFQVAEFNLVGTAPYMQARFSKKSQDKMEATQKAGSQARGKKVREAKDFEADFEAASYRSIDGWYGIPAYAFRAAAVSACRVVGFKMTLAKLSFFVEADGADAKDGTPLIRISGDPKMDVRHTRNATGVPDLRARPIWPEWSCTMRVRFDNGQFSLQDVANLVARIGLQVGIGEGRPDSRSSCGLGFGLFLIRS
jgi:hypothetical protein